ncbi:MAG: hypothetical protein IKG75_04970 [Bacteroidaceae bacterium]|nr:hypothetical protein [Bacteroidaceae bacterium]
MRRRKAGIIVSVTTQSAFSATKLRISLHVPKENGNNLHPIRKQSPNHPTLSFIYLDRSVYAALPHTNMKTPCKGDAVATFAYWQVSTGGQVNRRHGLPPAHRAAPDAEPVEIYAEPVEIYAEPVEIYAEPVEAESNRAEVKSNRVETKSNRVETERLCAIRFFAYTQRYRFVGYSLSNIICCGGCGAYGMSDAYSPFWLRGDLFGSVRSKMP